MEFKKFKEAVQERFDEMSKDTQFLFVTDVSGDDMWEKYLSSFPEGSNPIHIERTVHDCSACKHFIRHYGNVVKIVGAGEEKGLQSIWDVEIGDEYQPVADALSAMVKSAPVKDMFMSQFKNAGTDFNRQVVDGNVIRWDHFFLDLPRQFVEKNSVKLHEIQNEVRSSKEVLLRSINEITNEAVETVRDLIQQNSLYRGEEHKNTVDSLWAYKEACRVNDEQWKERYCWVMAASRGGSVKIRNSVIGSLLVDISEGTELDEAVRKFEAKVAPANYKRPKPVMTKRMIEQAREKIRELGYEESLARRCAVMDDIKVTNVLFANRTARKAMDPLSALDELEEAIPVDLKQFNKVEEIGIEDFVKNVLPNVSSMEVMVEGQHAGNLVSLVAPMNSSAPSMFKWRNGFSWAYAGEVADSIKERVKNAGGDVEGVLRWSLSWFNRDDLDLHVIEPNRNEIYFGNKGMRHPSTGMLDVDMNYAHIVTDPVENITWTDERRIQEGTYVVYVHNFTRRDSCDVGFEVEMEFKGITHRFSYSKPVANNERVQVAKFKFTRAGGIEFIEAIDGTAVSKEVWGIRTNNFANVSMMMFSPNHWEDALGWDGAGIGNRHYFFMLEGCQNPEPARGFFNEFLSVDLIPHRKVFEALGSKMKAQPVSGALCGVGFSSTRRSSVLCRVHGTFTRALRLMF